MLPIAVQLMTFHSLVRGRAGIVLIPISQKKKLRLREVT